MINYSRKYLSTNYINTYFKNYVIEEKTFVMNIQENNTIVLPRQNVRRINKKDFVKKSKKATLPVLFHL